MGWTDIGGNYHWGGTPGWTAAPEPPPEPEFVPPVLPPAPVAPPVAAPVAAAPVEPAPVEPLGPSISPGVPIAPAGGPPPTSTGSKIAQTVLPPQWQHMPKPQPSNTGGSINVTK
jgi:DNA polymerase-3 subunit gamma/tau